MPMRNYIWFVFLFLKTFFKSFLESIFDDFYFFHIFL